MNLVIAPAGERGAGRDHHHRETNVRWERLRIQSAAVGGGRERRREKPDQFPGLAPVKRGKGGKHRVDAFQILDREFKRPGDRCSPVLEGQLGREHRRLGMLAVVALPVVEDELEVIVLVHLSD